MKLLIGGSPCTRWSIAQTKNRETKPEGIGWELFLNYVIARDKFQPDYFLYENNKSMSAAIREQITKELGVYPVLINSALVSAQNRQRLYWVGTRNPDGTYSTVPVNQPEDRGIQMRDILESGVFYREKAYTLRASGCTKQGVSNIIGHIKSGGRFGYQGILEPVRIGTIESGTQTSHDSKPFRVHSPDGKAVTQQGEAGGYGAKTGLYACPVAGRVVGRRINEAGHRDDYNESLPRVQRFEVNDDPQKTNCLTTSCDKYEYCGTLDKPIYEVQDGQITINSKRYPIKLRNGCYIIRKLTVTECKRLQTVPDDYIFPVSNTQAYKMLGNGWTVDVIAHILSHIPGIATEPVTVLSMYDGMSCGHIALDKLGAKVERYYATEIDKWAIKTTQANYPDTVQLGDAFSVRDEDWKLEDA